MDVEILGSLLAFAAMIVTWAFAPSGKSKASGASETIPVAG